MQHIAALKEWKQEYACSWAPANSQLYALASEYDKRTEEFDQVHCLDRVNGVAIPRTSTEISLCSHNAQQVREELEQNAERAGFDKSQLREAINHLRGRK